MSVKQVEKGLYVTDSEDELEGMLRSCFYRNEDFWRKWLFIPRRLAKSNMREIYENFTIPNFHSGPGTQYTNEPILRRIGEDWLLIQSGGLDI